MRDNKNMETIKANPKIESTRGHFYFCDGCGCDGICCDTSNGGIIDQDGRELQIDPKDLEKRKVLLVGDIIGRRTEKWLCEDCGDFVTG